MAETYVYCHCAYARTVPEDTKEEVLEALVEAGVAFEAVSDLCEMSARKDAKLKDLAKAENLRLAACFPRAVHWLFSGAGAPLPESTKIFNMREEGSEEIVEGLLGGLEV